MIKKYKSLGLMSGSSLDGLDIAYCEMHWDGEQIVQWKIIQAETLAFSEKWIARLQNLASQNALIFAKTNVYFGHYMAELCNTFIEKHQIKDIDYIASHGHTIFHNPQQRISVQIGDAAALASLTGITTISDFRSSDIALDGEGAPLAPLVDQYLFKGFDFYLNLGGIANFSTAIQGKWMAFDVCPCNQILNTLAYQQGAEYDDKGQWASIGNTRNDLLQIVASFDYYRRRAPKSIGNEWIRQKVLPQYLAFDASINDKLATACEHVAIEIAHNIKQLITASGIQKEHYSLLVSGGGCYNDYLLQLISAYLNKEAEYNISIHMPNQEIINFKEAALMSLLGLLRLEGLPNSFQSATGAKKNSINGGIYAPN